jgi:hypothetical protein
MYLEATTSVVASPGAVPPKARCGCSKMFRVTHPLCQYFSAVCPDLEVMFVPVDEMPLTEQPLKSLCCPSFTSLVSLRLSCTTTNDAYLQVLAKWLPGLQKLHVRPAFRRYRSFISSILQGSLAYMLVYTLWPSNRSPKSAKWCPMLCYLMLS